MKLEYLNVNADKLHDELLASGIIPLLVESLEDKTWITFADGEDMGLVQQIIDAHDPTPSPPQPTVEDFNLEMDYRVTMLEMIGGI